MRCSPSACHVKLQTGVVAAVAAAADGDGHVPIPLRAMLERAHIKYKTAVSHLMEPRMVDEFNKVGCKIE